MTMNGRELICMACAKKARLKVWGTSMPIARWIAHWSGNREWTGLLPYCDAGCIVCKKNDEQLIVTCLTNLEVEKET